MSIISISELPTELLNQIFSYIVRPSHLIPLCLVSKTFSTFATRLLYEKLVLKYDYDDPGWTKYESLVHSSGLKYTTSITIGFCDSDRLEYCKLLDKLVPRLPRDSITRFEFGSHGRPTGDMLKLLWASQRNLRNVQLDFNILNPIPSELVLWEASIFQSLKGVTEVSMDFGSTVGPGEARQILDLLHLENLEVASFRVLPQNIPADSRSQTVISRKWDCLFQEKFPASLCQLTLTFVRLPKSSILQLDQYPHLSYLELRACQNADMILSYFKQPRLRRFRYCQESAEPDIIPLIVFLDHFSGLEELIIQYHEPLFREVIDSFRHAIALHSGSLRSLMVARLETQNSRGEGDCLESLATGCKQLRQLGIELPRSNHGVSSVCNLIKSIPTLRLINVFHQHSEPDSRSNRSARARTKVARQAFADAVVDEAQRWGHPLELVVFGQNQTFGDELQRLAEAVLPPLVVFARGSQQDLLGLGITKTVGVPVHSNLVNYVAPENSLLDYRFEREI